jgi:hypothetical protein
MTLPIYELKISDNLQDEAMVDYIALVDAPAIKKDFVAFKDQEKKIMFSILSEEQRIISGALMLADELIYRDNQKFGQHYVKFSADTIKSIAIKWAKKNFNNHVNLMHDPAKKVKGVTMFESWLVDSNRGIMPMKGFECVADGSWFGSFYVENEKVWQAIKKGDYKGFSVEGLFDYEEPITPEENALKKISELLNSTITE